LFFFVCICFLNFIFGERKRIKKRKKPKEKKEKKNKKTITDTPFGGGGRAQKGVIDGSQKKKAQSKKIPSAALTLVIYSRVPGHLLCPRRSSSSSSSPQTKKKEKNKSFFTPTFFLF
jgi:hypothetical protein